MALLLITMNKRQVYILLPDTIAIQWLLTPSRGVLIPRLLMGVEFLHTNDYSSLCAFDATFYPRKFDKKFPGTNHADDLTWFNTEKTVYNRLINA